MSDYMQSADFGQYVQFSLTHSRGFYRHATFLLYTYYCKLIRNFEVITKTSKIVDV